MPPAKPLSSDAGPAKPRVLVVTPDYPPAKGGIQILLHRVVTGWQYVEPTVVTLDHPEALAFDAEARAQPRRVRVPRLGGRLAAVAWLNAIAFLAAGRARPGAVLCGHVVAAPAAIALKRLTGLPFVLYLYANEVVGRPNLARRAIRQADAVIAISHHTMDIALAHGAEAERVHQIPAGVDPPSDRRASRSEHPTVVCIARMDERYKGHDVLLRAMPLVRARFPEARLVLIGDGALRAVHESLALALGLDEAVEFTGIVDDAERDAWLDRAHVFAMPSRIPPGGGGEGFGIVYLEAGAHNLPVIAAREGGALDAVVDGETGLLVDPFDHVAVADAICSLLEDPQGAEQMGRAGVARAREFSWQRTARQVEDLLLKIASSK